MYLILQIGQESKPALQQCLGETRGVCCSVTEVLSAAPPGWGPLPVVLQCQTIFQFAVEILWITQAHALPQWILPFHDCPTPWMFPTHQPQSYICIPHTCEIPGLPCSCIWTTIAQTCADPAFFTCRRAWRRSNLALRVLQMTWMTKNISRSLVRNFFYGYGMLWAQPK